MIRVGVLVTGGSDPRPTEIAVEVADRDSPDLTSRLLAALRSEIERRRVGAPVVVEVDEVEVTLSAVPPPVELPKPDA